MDLRRRPLTALAAAVLSTCSLAACGSPAAPAPASGDGATTAQERTLVIYSGRDEELVAPLLEQFEQASGIDVEARYAGTTELAAQLLTEGGDSPAQVFLSQDAGALGAVADAGLLAPLPDDVLATVPAEYRAADGSWVGLTGRARVIAYDSAELTADQVPGDVFGLLDERWRGQVGIAPSNASFQAFVTALRVTEGEERTRAWLEGLQANGAQVFERNGDILEAVETGAVDVGLLNHYYWARSEQDPATLRAQLRFGDPGTTSALVNATGVALLPGTSGEVSPEGLELARFLLSAQGQTYFAEETAEYPLADGAPDPAGVPALEELQPPQVDLSDLASLQETVDLMTQTGLL